MTPTVKKDTLSRGTKIAAGMGGLAMFYGGVGVNSLAVPFYQMMMGVSPALLGLALALPRFWDAVTDPVMGYVSDNFHSRFGRRRPFVLAGAWLMGLSFGLIWMVPQEWGEIGKLLWFIGASLLFYTFLAIFAVPYTSLTYEMTPDYDERTRVMGYATFFSKLGEFTYQWVIPATGLAIFASMVEGVRIIGWVIGIIGMGVLGSIPALFVKERYYKVREKETARIAFWRSFGQSLKSKPFLILLGLLLLQVFTGMLGASMDHYLLVYYMFDGDIIQGSLWKGVLSSCYAVVGFASIPVISWACRRFDKSRVLVCIYMLTCLGGLARWFIFTPGNHFWVVLDPLFNSYYWIATGMIIPSMIADICDEDELGYGLRREGIFSSVYSWVMKTATSFAFFGTGLALVWAGFNSESAGAQGEDTFLFMRMCMAGGNIVPSLLAIVLVFFYPIDRRRAAETRARLESLRGSV